MGDGESKKRAAFSGLWLDLDSFHLAASTLSSTNSAASEKAVIPQRDESQHVTARIRQVATLLAQLLPGDPA